MAIFVLRKQAPCDRIRAVRRIVIFLQYGTSARLVALFASSETHARIRAGMRTPRAWRKEVFAASASARSETGRDGARALRVPAGKKSRRGITGEGGGRSELFPQFRRSAHNR